MKLTILFLFVGLMQVSASLYSQNTKLNLDLRDTRVVDVLEAIENQSDFRFAYSAEFIDMNRKVNVDVKRKNITQTLSLLFEGTDVKFTVDDRHILLFRAEMDQNVTQQQKTVTGKVNDSSGLSLPGVSVVVKGTTIGTITDTNGNFSLSNVPDGATLEFSFIGMKTIEMVVGNKTTISVVMADDVVGLEQVVVVGYGTQKKSSVSGSIAQVGSQELTKVPATNISALLAGRLPGLIVTSNSGQPGRDEANISIRGFGNALTIVDGVARDFQQLDPNEIESISILKDAAAAVYGAQAGNGVILVTTKKGKKNSAPQINYTANFSVQQPTYMTKLANAYQYASFRQTADKLAGTLPANYYFSDEAVAKYKAGTEPGYKGTDWQDVCFKNWAPQQQHNMNVSGGTDNVTYFFSLGDLNQKSMLKSGSGDYNRYNISSNVDVNISKKLKANLNLKYRIEDRDDPISRGVDPNEYYRIFRYILTSKPTVELIPDQPDLMVQCSEQYENPLAYTREDITGFSKDKRRQFDMIFSLDYQLPVKGLSVKGQVALKDYDQNKRSLQKPYSVYTHNYQTGTNTPVASLVENAVTVDTWSNRDLSTQFSIDYSGKFGDHSVTGKVLSEYIYADSYEMGSSRQDLISSDIPYLFSGGGVQTNWDEPDQDGRKSVVGRFNYSYKEKYLVEALFRADASINFPSNTRWGFFPGFSLGWRISQEPFLNSVKSINELKLRTSYSHLGYDKVANPLLNKVSNFDYLTGYQLQSQMVDMYGYGSTMNISTLKSIGLANPDITWEDIYLYNIGLDGTFWKGLLGFEMDVFYRKRSGILGSMVDVLPSTFGANLPDMNINERSNRGFELVVNHKNTIGQINYSLSGNVTWAREKYGYFAERAFDPNDPDDARINQKSNQWVNRTFGYKTDGFYNTQAEIDNNTIDQSQIGSALKLGDVRYVDVNNDQVINYKDQVVLGKGNTPELFFGLNMSLSYKNFDFSALWQGAANYNIMINGVERSTNLSIGFVPQEYQYLNAWNPDHPNDAKLPAPNNGGLNTHNDKNSDLYLIDGGYLRLKNINIGYNVPSSFLGKFGVKSLRVYAAAYNLLTFKHKSIFDFDPESRAGDSGSVYPVQKVITLGVNVGL